MKRFLSIAAALAVGVLIGLNTPALQHSFRLALAAVSPATAELGHDHGHGHSDGADDGHGDHAEPAGEHKDREGQIKLSPAQIAAAKIQTATVESGTLAKRLAAPGVVMVDPDRIYRVAAKVAGVVGELRKRLGEVVQEGELLAVIESREVAEAKSEYLAARSSYELQTQLYEREKTLYDKKIAAEQQFLRAGAAYTEARLRLDLARQKLAALDVSEREVAEHGSGSNANLSRKEIRAPFSGRIIERRVNVGAPVGGDGQEKELYVIADLASVWAELFVATSEIARVREGQTVRAADGLAAIEGKIIFVSPTLDRETRTARVIASFPNTNLQLRPGAFLTTQIGLEELAVDLRVPSSAVQKIEGRQVVFVRTGEGFEKREVGLGASDEDAAEIVSGLKPGEEIAVANTFTLKAELGKSEAEHSH